MDYADGTDSIMLVGSESRLSYEDLTIGSLQGDTVIKAKGISAILPGIDRSLINTEDFTIVNY